MLEGLLVNFALLIAAVCVVSLTYHHLDTIDSLAYRSARWYLCVGTSFLLLGHAVVFAPGILFGLHAVPLALITRRGGLVWGLLALPSIAAYRLHLGGPGAWPDVLSLVIVVLLTGATTRVVAANQRQMYKVWWVPAGIFTVAHTTVFVAYHLAGRSFVEAFGAYVLFSTLSAFGMIAAHFVTQTRIDAIRHAATLERLAFLDPLTGAFNRRQFNHDADELDGEAYLLLLDIDHFKRVNDTYGHDVGDEVLIAVARALREHLRPADRVYRLGGEEFAVLLNPCEASAAPLVAQRARAGVERDAARLAGLPAEVLTVSGGLTAVRGGKRDSLKRADELLYAAKAGGRNRVASEAPPAAVSPVLVTAS